jgi:hypothetical protein
MGKITSGAIVGGYVLDSAIFSAKEASAAILSSVYVAKNGTPADNVAKVIEMRFGGIENIIGLDDIVVINPNGQWPNQGGSNCENIMGLFDLILNRPGGFNGEIIFTECTQFQNFGYWTAEGSGLDRNGPYNFNDMITYYQNQGHDNVNGIRLWRNMDDPGNWPLVSGPQDGQGWVRVEWNSPGGYLFGFSYPIIESPYSGKLIDLKNGVYDNGYGGQPALKFIKVPNLNNHGHNAQQDYAGITSAVKSFLGISEVGGWSGHRSLHQFENLGAYACGQAIGAWMNAVRKPDFFLTTAEWVGWGSRTSSQATQARTVGLCDDPVSLDYYMSKYVMWPTHPQQNYFNPDYNIPNNNTRQTMNGCCDMGYGTTNESEIAAFVYDYDTPSTFRFDIDRKIRDFQNGNATMQDVLDLIESYNQGN